MFFNSALVVVLSAASLTSNATVSNTFAAEQFSPLEFKPPLSILLKPSVKLFLSELSELKPIASSSLSRFKYNYENSLTMAVMLAPTEPPLISVILSTL